MNAFRFIILAAMLTLAIIAVTNMPKMEMKSQSIVQIEQLNK